MTLIHDAHLRHYMMPGSNVVIVRMQDEWQWSRLDTDPSSSPPKRDMAQMVVLDNDQLVLFGGRSEQGRALADTWSFSLSK